MIIKDFPAFAFPPLRDCAYCGRTLEDDEGGVPANPKHPFYQKWICDDCNDAIHEKRKLAWINPEFEAAVQKMIEEAETHE